MRNTTVRASLLAVLVIFRVMMLIGGFARQLLESAAQLSNTLSRATDPLRNGDTAGITTATAEQSTGIQQVGVAVNQMDQVTQQNAALVEQAAAAASALERQAQSMKDAVSVFRVGALA